MIRRVCSGAVELDLFALANAVLRGDTDTALMLSSAVGESGLRFARQVTRVFRDLTPFGCASTPAWTNALRRRSNARYKAGLYVSACKNRSAEALARAVEICRKADLKLKSTPVPGDVILARLVASKL